MKFRDRIDAGNLLAERLAENGYTPAIVLGIPRGGVILADIVAKKLAADFDIVVPRKLGAPENEELAIGAVMEDGTSYINSYIVNALRIPQDYIEGERVRQAAEIRRRSTAYRRPDLSYKIAGKMGKKASSIMSYYCGSRRPFSIYRGARTGVRLCYCTAHAPRFRISGTVL
jgi:predicted phosphoribosyltransferase